MRWLKRILIFVLIVLIGVGVYGFLTVRSSFPQLNGELEVVGLNQEVTVIRDGYGIPHIYAETPADLFKAQGYVEAQDRFFQMDFWRHIGAGRLSEMFGESQLGTDKFLRALNFTATAQIELTTISQEARDILGWYSEGVNAYLTSHQGSAASLEYPLMALQASGYVPDPWTPLNTLTWAKVMSWDLSSNFGDEIARTVLGDTLTEEQVEQLYPPYPDGHPVIVPSEIRSAAADRTTASLPDAAITALLSVEQSRRTLSELTGGGFEGIGSNNWVISGKLTSSGMPILANDPHLAIQIPSIWYEIGLHCSDVSDTCPFEVTGFSFPGTPGVVIGHNASIAWGVTTEAADTQDLYIEKINPENANQYEVDGEWVDMDVRAETIDIAGGASESYEVRTTKHGPIISGLHGGADQLDDVGSNYPDGFEVSLAWQSLQPSTLIESILQIDLASDWDDFRSAASLWDVAAQNLVYADIEGNIGYQSTGEIPIRPNSDGLRPVPGWDSSNDWVGIVPFDEMPFVFNPERGYMASANQPVLEAGAEPFIGRDGAYGYRAARIDEMINATAIHTVESVQAMQMDNRDGGAANLVQHLVAVPTREPNVLEIQNLLEVWALGKEGFQATWDSAGSAAYQATWRKVLELTFNDDLPEEYWPDGGSRWFEVFRVLIDHPDDPFWDIKGTNEIETADVILQQAMNDAHTELTELLGDNALNWKWGNLHTAEFENQTLGQSGIGPIEWLFNRSAPRRVSGGPSLVNATGWSATVGYEVDWVPSMRMVVDLGDFSRSTSIHTTGQSGHAFQANYADMIEMWTDGGQHPMLWSREDVDNAAANTLILKPAGSG
jgi:penicillin G amidase